MAGDLYEITSRKRTAPTLRLFLGLLPLAILACMALTGWLMVQSHRHATIISQIEYAGGTVSEDRLPDPLLPQFLSRRKLVSVTLHESANADAALRHVARLTRLDNLWLINTTVSESGLAQLERLHHLKMLSIQGVPVSDASLAHIEHLSDLKLLLIKDTQITQQAIEKLKQTLPNLEVLVADEPPDAASGEL